VKSERQSARAWGYFCALTSLGRTSQTRSERLRAKGRGRTGRNCGLGGKRGGCQVCGNRAFREPFRRLRDLTRHSSRWLQVFSWPLAWLSEAEGGKNLIKGMMPLGLVTRPIVKRPAAAMASKPWNRAVESSRGIEPWNRATELVLRREGLPKLFRERRLLYSF
jgi:hypothetical protein